MLKTLLTTAAIALFTTGCFAGSTDDLLLAKIQSRPEILSQLELLKKAPGLNTADPRAARIVKEIESSIALAKGTERNQLECWEAAPSVAAVKACERHELPYEKSAGLLDASTKHSANIGALSFKEADIARSKKFLSTLSSERRNPGASVLVLSVHSAYEELGMLQEDETRLSLLKKLAALEPRTKELLSINEKIAKADKTFSLRKEEAVARGSCGSKATSLEGLVPCLDTVSARFRAPLEQASGMELPDLQDALHKSSFSVKWAMHAAKEGNWALAKFLLPRR